MGNDAFESLGLPRKLSLSAGEIETRWSELSREVHPDSESGDADRAAEINQAYNILRHVGPRLRHWLELQKIDIPRNASISEELMTQFSEVGDLLTIADAFLAKKSKATSAIAKALLADEEFSVQKTIQTRMGTLKSRIEKIEAQFTEFENDPSLAIRGLEQLRFLEKWNQQCQDRLVAIMSL